MNTLSISTRTDRLSKVFEDWQTVALSKLPDGNEDPKSTRALWIETKAALKEEFSGRERSISRASVINFLTKLAEMGLIDGVDAIGKGGKRHDYRYIMDRKSFNDDLSAMLLGAIIAEYPDVDLPRILDGYHPRSFEKMLTA